MVQQRTRNPLLPLYIGVPIIVVADIFLAIRIWSLQCDIPGIEIFLVLGLMPVLYVVLMYFALKSQP